MKGKLSLDSIVTTTDLNIQMAAAKKHTTHDRTSSVSEWSSAIRRSPTDEHFPTNGVDSCGSRKKRPGWTDVVTSKRKVASGAYPTGEDPFAGMNTRINYQQEIERLKALVPKVDTKRRSLPTRSRPQSLPQQQQQLGMEEDQENLPLDQHRSSTSSSGSSWYDDDSDTSAGVRPKSRAASPPVAPPSLASSAQSSSSDSQTSSVLSDDESESASSTSSTNKASAAAITEEEKARFMAFVRKWTGGCSWQDWGNYRSSSDVVSLDNDSSLWAKSSPWESNRHHTLDSRFFSPASSINNTTTESFLHLSRQDSADYYYNSNPHYYPIQQEQYPTQHHHHHLYANTYYHEPKPLPHNSHPISAIGERNQPTDTSAFRRISRLGRNGGAPFGVFVI